MEFESWKEYEPCYSRLLLKGGHFLSLLYFFNVFMIIVWFCIAGVTPSTITMESA